MQMELDTVMNENRALSDMESCLETIKQSPVDQGTVVMIVSRPVTLQREVIEHAELDAERGLAGDNWLSRGDRHTADGRADPGRQLTLMNSRAIEAVAGEQENWPGAGDQFFVDLDLSDANLPPGTQLAIGEAVIEVTDLPHLGCKKFGERYGRDANMFVNSELGKSLNLRGINARVVAAGSVGKGDSIRKVE